MTPPKLEMNPVVRRFIEDAGALTQSLGIGRVIGQIYAYLYFSKAPCNLADLQDSLGISKGSASMGVRQLEQWGAVRKVWVRGDRKDYYEANDWFGRILKNAVVELVGKRLDSYASLLEHARAEMQALGEGNGEAAFIRERLEHVERFASRAQKLWNSPLVHALLK